MMSAARQVLQAMMATINRRALEILELPESEREARYRHYWKACYDANLAATGRPAFAVASRTSRAAVALIEPTRSCA